MRYLKLTVSLCMILILSVSMLPSCNLSQKVVSDSRGSKTSNVGDLDFDAANAQNSGKQSSRGGSAAATSGSATDKIDVVPNANAITNPQHIDFHGATLNIGSWWGFQSSPGSDETGIRERALIAKVEKTYNCKLNFLAVTTGTSASTKASILAGKPNVAMFPVQDALVAYDYYTSGCLLSLDKMDTINLKDTSRFSLCDLTRFNGKTYGVAPITFGWLRRNFNVVLMCNFDLTAKAGYSYKTIYKWVQDGQWNWANFGKVLAGVSKLGSTTNGIYPISDYYTYSTAYNGLYMNQQLYYAMLWNNNTDWIVKSGSRFKFNGGSANAIAVLNQYTEWAKKGYIKFDAVDTKSDYSAGKSAFVNCIMITPISNKYSFTYGALPYPKGPSATKYVNRQIGLMNVVIPKGVSNPRGVVAVMDALCTPLYTESESAAVFKGQAQKNAELPESVSYLQSVYNDSSAFQLANGVFGQELKLGYTTDTNNKGWYNLVTAVATGNMTAQSAVDTFTTKANTTLASIYH